MAEDMSQMVALQAAVVEAQKIVKGVGHDAKNAHQGYKYTSAEGIIAGARVALAAAGLSVRQTTWTMAQPEPWLEGYAESTRQGDNPSPFIVTVTFELSHREGGCVLESVPWPALVGPGRPIDKALAGALTTALSYYLRGILLIDRPDADDDIGGRDDANYQPRGRGADGQRGGSQSRQDPPRSRSDDRVESSTSDPPPRSQRREAASEPQREAPPKAKAVMADAIRAHGRAGGWLDDAGKPDAAKLAALRAFVGWPEEGEPDPGTVSRAVEIVRLGHAELLMRMEAEAAQAAQPSPAKDAGPAPDADAAFDWNG